MKTIIYPDGSGHMGKFLKSGQHEFHKMECAKIKVGDKEIIIHADEVQFEGAGLYEILMKMADKMAEMARQDGSLGVRISACERKLKIRRKAEE